MGARFFFWLLLGLGFGAWRACDGTWTYAFDDAYIHLAMSHNLAFSGVWGVSPTGFASASSSPLWTFVLAGALGVCNSELMPLALNVVFCALAIGVTARAWQSEWSFARFSWRAQGMGLVAFCAVVPLATLCLIGMEHGLHLLLALCFLRVASGALGEGRSARSLPLWACLMGGARFEGVFLAGWTALFLLRQKRFGAALATLGASLVPFVLHGLMARSQGWPFVAVSVALKRDRLPTDLSDSIAWLGSVSLKMMNAWPLTLMALVALALANRVSSRSLGTALPLFALAALSHIILAMCGVFFRYEAYLFGMGIAVLWPALGEAFPRHTTRAAMGLHLAGVMIAFGCLWRAGAALVQTPGATRNIYWQQRQMARFIERFYPRDVVVLNDIGTTDWAAIKRADEHVALDLIGLSDFEVARLRMAQPDKNLPSDSARALLARRGARLAIIYDFWFPSGVFPSNWTRVAQWNTGPKIVTAGTHVSFWTPRSNAARLRKQLQKFNSELPRGVTTSWEKRN